MSAIVTPREAAIERLQLALLEVIERDAQTYETIDIFCAVVNVGLHVALKQRVRPESVKNAFLDLLRQATERPSPQRH